MNKVMKSRKYVVFLLLLLAMVVGTAVVHAITIAIDGVKESVWSTGENGQVPGSSTDSEEPSINDRFDIVAVSWTNDSNNGSAPYGNMYWLIETIDEFDSTIDFPTSPAIVICLNVDNDTGTGSTVSGYCNDMEGVDRRVNVDPVGNTVVVRRWTGSAFVTVNMPSGGLRGFAWADDNSDGIADYPYMEVGVDLQSLGITSSSACISTMPASIYYDNGIIDNEDQTPNTGTINMGCGSPTAVSLQSFTPAGNSTLPVVAFIGFLALVIVSFGVVIVRREQRKA